jgi:hypothetical protein
MAIGEHANDSAAAAVYNHGYFFRAALVFTRYAYLCNLAWLIPLIGWWRVMARHCAAST